MEVYKYLPPERKSFFKNYKLAFTQPMGFNDPYECLPGISDTDYEQLLQSVVDSPESKEIISGFDDNPTLQNLILKELNKAKKQKEEEYKKSSIVEQTFMEVYKKNLNNRVGIFCLSKRNNSSLMWSHYANGHKGFVVGFDSNNSFFSKQPDDPTDIGTLEEVKYASRRLEIDILDIQITSEMFLVKNEVWKYEEEMRLIRRLDHASETINKESLKIYLFSIPKESICSIIFGIHSPQDLKEEIFKNVRSDEELTDVKFYQSFMDYKSFDIQIEPLKLLQSTP